jgi:hypothetical protein
MTMPAPIEIGGSYVDWKRGKIARVISISNDGVKMRVGRDGTEFTVSLAEFYASWKVWNP